jgi:hypothetical protein
MSRRLEHKRARVEAFEGVDKACTLSARPSRRCRNPVCDNTIEIVETWRGTEKLHCSVACRMVASFIRRAAALLVPLGKERAWQVLSSFVDGTEK